MAATPTPGGEKKFKPFPKKQITYFEKRLLEERKRVLKELGVDYAQGYWLGEPRALEVYSVFDQTVPLAGVAAAVPAPEEVTLRLSN